jgi:hypothetical protein
MQQSAVCSRQFLTVNDANIAQKAGDGGKFNCLSLGPDFEKTVSSKTAKDAKLKRFAGENGAKYAGFFYSRSVA